MLSVQTVAEQTTTRITLSSDQRMSEGKSNRGDDDYSKGVSSATERDSSSKDSGKEARRPRRERRDDEPKDVSKPEEEGKPRRRRADATSSMGGGGGGGGSGWMSNGNGEVSAQSPNRNVKFVTDDEDIKEKFVFIPHVSRLVVID
jgi:hypothetical protein